MQEIQEMSHEQIALEDLPFSAGQPPLAILLRQGMHPVNVNLVELELQNSLGYFRSEMCGVCFQDTTQDGRTAFDSSSLLTHICLHGHSLSPLCPFVAGQSKSALA